jgi:hypothetical protein
MKLAAYAKRIRALDWEHLGSEPEDPYFESQYTATAWMAETTPNHARLWELANHFYRGWQWKWVGGRKPVGMDPAGACENTWRWIGAYLWAHGIQVEPKEAERFIEDRSGWYYSFHEKAECIVFDVNWSAIDAFIKVASK